MRAALVKRPNHTRAAGWLLAAALSVTGSVAWAQVTVALNAPANGATYVPPVNITLSASASASQGYTVSKVEFFNGTTLIGTDTSSPYSITWNNAPSGQHVLTAKATAIKKNSPDQTATSTAVNITVNAPPVVNFTNPAELSIWVPIPPPGTPLIVTLSATATDSDGSISKVEFWDRGCQFSTPPALLASITAPPYTFNWTIPAPYQDSGKPRSYCVKAIATDNLGAVTQWQTSDDERLVLLTPTLAITSPMNGASYAAPGPIVISVAFTPADYPVERVQFYNGETLIGESLTAPYSFNWENVPSGSYSLTAKMIGTPYPWETTSTPVSVTVSTQSQLHFIHVDHLNSPRLIANAAGQTVWRRDNQEPFNDSPPDENPSGLGVFEFPLGFAGQYFDKETGNWYNGFRDYASGLGRYVQSDPIGLKGGSLNTYAYAKLDPLRRIDPAGLEAPPVAEPPVKPPVAPPQGGPGDGPDCINIPPWSILVSSGGIWGFMRTVTVQCSYYCQPAFCPRNPGDYIYQKTFENQLQIAPWLNPCPPKAPRSLFF